MWRMLWQALFHGRYGFDEFSRFLLISGLGLQFIALFLPAVEWLNLLRLAGLALIIWALFRMFSRNLAARQAEARRFNFMRQDWRNRLQNLRQAWPRLWNGQWWREHRTYKYLRCPRCAARLRVPRGKGRIIITCTRCKHKIESKT